MKNHVWVTVEHNDGALGLNDYWECTGCGAAGGPAFPNQMDPTFPPFIPGHALKLSEDCDESKQQIADLAKALSGGTV